MGDCVVRKGQCLRKTLLSASALAKVIYERLFKWVVKKCNTAIECHSGSNGTVSGTTSFVGVLDMAGFEIMAQNSFEQLCINYTNERLQQLFNEFIFIREQEEYRKEGIRWTETNFGLDLQPTIDLIEKPLGILSLLQEQCIMPNGNDSALLDKLQNGLSGAQANADAPPLFALSKHSTK